MKAWKTRRKNAKKKPKKRVTGTREWASSTRNCVNGCSHGCKYCYATYDASDRFHRMKREEWVNMRVRWAAARKKQNKEKGVVMFPTTHDIQPEVLMPCMILLRNLVEAGNKVLVVSKPHLECIDRITDELSGFKKQIMFRFTIGAMSDDILKHWEPGAPSFDERFTCLAMARSRGFRTSVSCEPLLEPEIVDKMIEKFDPYVTDTIWIGKLNHIDKRVHATTKKDKAEVRRIKGWQTDAVVKSIYERHKKNKKVRWKDSYKEVVGLPSAEEEGLDV